MTKRIFIIKSINLKTNNNVLKNWINNLNSIVLIKNNTEGHFTTTKNTRVLHDSVQIVLQN
jgi:hypothetical protein